MKYILQLRSNIQCQDQDSAIVSLSLELVMVLFASVASKKVFCGNYSDVLIIQLLLLMRCVHELNKMQCLKLEILSCDDLLLNFFLLSINLNIT